MVALAEKCIFLNIRVLPVYPDANWKRHFEVISSLRALITTMGCDTYCWGRGEIALQIRICAHSTSFPASPPINISVGISFSLSFLSSPILGGLQIESSEETDQGKYECVASNSAGVRYSSPANLYVRGRERRGSQE